MRSEITFQNGAVALSGTLFRPEAETPCPLVIAAHTSGAGTRDFGVYQHLASVLPRNGLAVFLFDRRGSGRSTGDFETATFFDLAADIQAAIDHLKPRPDLDPDQIGLWGMSQGGWIAPLTAAQSPDVAFLTVISAAGVSPAEQMSYCAEFELRENGFSEEDINQMLELRGLADSYFRGAVDKTDLEQKLVESREQAWFAFSYLDGPIPEDPARTKWYQEMDFDPIPTLQKTDIPVLLLYAERDPWVPIAVSIARWQEFGPKDLTIHQIQGANHFMIASDQSGLRGDTGPLVEEYTTVLTHWLKSQVK